jgi:hypothetical protein
MKKNFSEKLVRKRFFNNALGVKNNSCQLALQLGYAGRTWATGHNFTGKNRSHLGDKNQCEWRHSNQLVYRTKNSRATQQDAVTNITKRFFCFSKTCLWLFCTLPQCKDKVALKWAYFANLSETLAKLCGRPRFA